MEMDKELYRKYYNEIGEWKEREAIEEALSRRHLTSQQAWEEYLTLWKLASLFSPENDENLQIEHLKYWEEYYEKIQKLQTWLKANGKAA